MGRICETPLGFGNIGCRQRHRGTKAQRHKGGRSALRRASGERDLAKSAEGRKEARRGRVPLGRICETPLGFGNIGCRQRHRGTKAQRHKGGRSALRRASGERDLAKSAEGRKEARGAACPWGEFVEPRWGSVVGSIGNPACAARHWALEFNAVGVRFRKKGSNAKC